MYTDININDLIKEWSRPPFDKETSDKLKLIKSTDELHDRFYKRLNFGTGGLRAVMGVGTNRMNIYTVASTSQGLADFMTAQNPWAPDEGVLIGYDSRNNSELYAKTAAAVFAKNGIQTYIFPTLTPVSMVAHGLQELKCFLGVMITASHNTSEYNGYKVYWRDGSQIVSPFDKEIWDYTKRAEISPKLIFDYDQLYKAGKINIAGNAIANTFYKKGLQLLANNNITNKNDLKIVFSSLHGTGNIPVIEMLKIAGFENILTVDEQMEPNGNFPTVKTPNPEEKSALKMSIDLAIKNNCDLVIATDPDADRIGTAVKDLSNNFITISGNQMGAILLIFRINRFKELDKLPTQSAVISTIVSTRMIKKITEAEGLKYFDTLTGFKHIGKMIREFENHKLNHEESYEFFMGIEESYGYLLSDFIRDKDGVTTAAAICEMALYCKKNKSSIYEYLLETFRNYGCFHEKLVSKEYKGDNGIEKINQIMDNLRNPKSTRLQNLDLIKIVDYNNCKIINPKKGSEEHLSGYPITNLLQLYLADDSIISIRPSGTEPKIKFYFSVYEITNNEMPNKKIELIYQALGLRIEKLIKILT